MNTKRKIIVLFATAVLLTSFSTAFAGGDGSSSKPYQISTCQQLQDMQNNLSANYELVSDVDCSSYSGFSSVGDSGNQFTGVLDGQGHTVSGLTINEGSSDHVGLIGYMGSSSVVKNIGVVNVDITGSTNVGGLIGYNEGSVSNSFSTG
ncbi:MAG: GLUG motif-containing protein, partial [Candidatus Nanohalobium sp.]